MLTLSIQEAESKQKGAILIVFTVYVDTVITRGREQTKRNYPNSFHCICRHCRYKAESKQKGAILIVFTVYVDTVDTRQRASKKELS